MKTAELVTDSLAVARLTHLLQQDDIPPMPVLRERFEDWARDRPIAEWATCPWCLSPWLAVAVLLARRIAPRPWGQLSKILAASYIAARLESL